MGSLMAARLTRGMSAGSRDGSAPSPIERVLLYGRSSAHIDAIRERGLTLTELDGRSVTIPVEATSNPAEVAGSDLVVVLVKAWASAEAVAPLAPYLTRDAIVLTLQNGLGNAAMLRSALLHDGVRPHVWLGVTTQAAIRTAPGEITHTGDGLTAIGRRTTEVNARLRDLAIILSDAGWQTVAVEDIHRWVWRKLAVNAAINPLTALAGVPNAAISTDPGLKEAARVLATEVADVARARGVSLNLEQVIAAVEEVARATGVNRSSMLVDLEQGMRTEIDAINGAVVREARRHGMRVTANELVTSLVRARERAQQGLPSTEDAASKAPEAVETHEHVTSDH
jgi:2-dehydropantoate 2-reductase